MVKRICITPIQEEALNKAIARGEFSLDKLKKTKSSEERIELVSEIFDDIDISKKVVRDIETRLGSKKQDIVEGYLKRNFSSVPENTTKGVFNRFKRMNKFLGAKEEKDFLKELVAHKFGAYVSKEEANNFEKLTNEAIVLKDKIPKDSNEITEASRDYGAKLVEIENAESKIIIERTGFNKQDFKKFKGQKGKELISSWSKYLTEGFIEFSGATRAFKATADLSATFRQLWKIFASGVSESIKTSGKKNDKLKIWANSLKTTIKAVKDTAKFGDERVYDAIRAEIHAHPNSYNGIFDAAKNSYGLRVGVEEQFPSSIPSSLYEKHVSKTNNIFKISEVAFNSTVLKARFDLANLTINTLKKDGVNIMDKKFADPAGEFVSAFTGRGGLGTFEQGSITLNKILFAPRYASSQFSPYFQILRGVTTGADNKASRLAVEQNLEFIAGSLGLLIAGETARAFITGDDTNYTSALNPLSNRFGRVTFPGSEVGIDFTGGNRSVVGLFAKLSSDKFYDARLGVWREKSFFELSDGKTIMDFTSGKLAPVPALVRDLKRGEHFGGKEITVSTMVQTLLMPITIDNVLTESVSKEDLSTALIVLAAEGTGLGVTDIRFKPQSDEWSALLNTDSKAYWRAVDELWLNVHTQVKSLRNNEDFQSLSREEQTKRLERIYKIQLKQVIRQDKYKTEEEK